MGKLVASHFGCSNLFVIIIVTSLCTNRITILCNQTENIWTEAGAMVGALLDKCINLTSQNQVEINFFQTLQQCLKQKSLIALDDVINEDIIELTSCVELVKYNNTDSNRNIREEFLDEYWEFQVLRKIQTVFSTHILKIYNNSDMKMRTEGRRRRRRHTMMPLMMFGITALGMIMIPMGFQFLAVLGGKALLLAKMALLLTSIQGLKKIATSNVNYGLYASPEHKQWHYDRQWPYDLTYTSEYNLNPTQHTDLLHPIHPRIENKYTQL